MKFITDFFFFFLICLIYLFFLVSQSLANEIIYITRPVDKKKIMFYNDKTANLTVDEEFQKLWRSVAVESMDDQKIEEYLEKQVI